MKKFNSITSLFIVLLMFNCVNDSQDDLIDNTLPPVVVTYDDVSAIFNNNCNFCHGNTPTNGANISLVTYQNVVDGITNNNLIERISLLPGEGGAMPVGGPQLPQNTIDLIIEWKNQGFLEN